MFDKENHPRGQAGETQEDLEKTTEHHRKPESLGGDKSPRNISHVPLFKHRAWHTLYDNYEAPEIIRLFAQDYEVYGIEWVKSELLTDLHEKWANSTLKKVRRTKAWYTLFEGKSLDEIVVEVNAIWLDPDYEISIGLIRVKTIQWRKTGK
jgi:hypothetical protein